MKTIEISKPTPKAKIGEYSSIDALVNTKMERASHTLKNIDLSKVNKFKAN